MLLLVHRPLLQLLFSNFLLWGHKCEETPHDRRMLGGLQRNAAMTLLCRHLLPLLRFHISPPPPSPFLPCNTLVLCHSSPFFSPFTPLFSIAIVDPMGLPHRAKVRCSGDRWAEGSKLTTQNPPRKIIVTRKPPVGGVPVVTLVRTDTTLDLSQKAEKVCQL